MLNVSQTLAVPATVGDGAPGDCRAMGWPRLISFNGDAVSNRIAVQASADNVNYVEVPGAERTGFEWKYAAPVVARYMRVHQFGTTVAGVCGVSGPPIPQGSNPTAQITVPVVVNTSGPAVDCRAMGPHRSVIYAGTVGDQILIEGSWNGTDWFDITSRTVLAPQSGAAGFIHTSDEEDYSWVRCTRLAGTTAGRCDVTGESNAPAVPIISGGTAQPMAAGVLPSVLFAGVLNAGARVVTQRTGVNASTALGELDAAATYNAGTFVLTVDVTAKKPADATTEAGDLSSVQVSVIDLA